MDYGEEIDRERCCLYCTTLPVVTLRYTLLMGLIEKAVVFVTLPVVYIEVHIADGCGRDSCCLCNIACCLR